MGDQKTLRVTQIRSAIKRQKKQQRTLDALGIRRIRHTVEHADSPQLRGMLAAVAHLVKVEETQNTGCDNETWESLSASGGNF